MRARRPPVAAVARILPAAHHPHSRLAQSLPASPLSMRQPPPACPPLPLRRYKERRPVAAAPISFPISSSPPREHTLPSPLGFSSAPVTKPPPLATLQASVAVEVPPSVSSLLDAFFSSDGPRLTVAFPPPAARPLGPRCRPPELPQLQNATALELSSTPPTLGLHGEPADHHLARRHPGAPLVLAGHTLSPARHHSVAGERATIKEPTTMWLVFLFLFDLSFSEIVAKF
jgi:hypothetical protein